MGTNITWQSSKQWSGQKIRIQSLWQNRLPWWTNVMQALCSTLWDDVVRRATRPTEPVQIMIPWVQSGGGKWDGGNHPQHLNDESRQVSRALKHLTMTDKRFYFGGSHLAVQLLWFKGPLLYCFASIYYRSQIYTEHVSEVFGSKHQTDHCSIP